MSTDGFLRFADWAVAKVLAYGRDATLAVFVGWLASVLAPLPGRWDQRYEVEPWRAFFVGFFGTTAVLAFALGRLKHLEAELKELKRLRDAGLLLGPDHDRLAQRAVEWYAARRYGGALPAAKRTPVGRDKPSTEPEPSPGSG